MGAYTSKQPQDHTEKTIVTESGLDRIHQRPFIIDGYTRKYTSCYPQEIKQLIYNFLFTQILSYQLQTIGGDQTTAEPLENLTTMKTFRKQIKNIINSDRYVYVLFTDSTDECIGYGGRGGGYKSWLIDIFDKMKIKTSSNGSNLQINRIFSSPMAEHTFCVDNDNNTYIHGRRRQHTWTQLNIQMKIQKIAITENVTVFLNDNGQLFVCGKDGMRDGILGLGTEIFNADTITQIDTKSHKFISVYCGLVHTLALDCEGQIWSWGHGGSGRLGHGDGENRYEPTRIKWFMDNNIKVSQICCGTWYSVVLTNTGKIYTFGSETNLGVSPNRCVPIPKLNETLKNEKIVSIQCGAHHQMAKNSKNDYYLWGENHYNQCMSTLTPNPPSYVEKPLLLEWKKLIHKSQELIDVYVGRYSTRILLGNSQPVKKTDLGINKELFGMPSDTFKSRNMGGPENERDFNWEKWMRFRKDELPELGNELYHCATEVLTESKSQYEIEVIKRIYSKYIALQFNVQHTLEKQIIADVFVDIETKNVDSRIMNIKCSRIKRGRIGITAAIIERALEREDIPILIGKYECALKCMIEGIDDTIYDKGYEDTCTLTEKIDFYFSDYVYPLSLMKNVWTNFGTEEEVMKEGTLNYESEEEDGGDEHVKSRSLQNVVDFVVKSVGLAPVAESHKIDTVWVSGIGWSPAQKHGLRMMGYNDKGQPICMKAFFWLKDDAIQYKVAVRCQNELLRDQCLHVFD